MHSTWDKEDAVEEEDAEDKVVAVDAANAHHLQPTCKTKRRDAVDEAITEESQSRQEGQQWLAYQQRKWQHTQT